MKVTAGNYAWDLRLSLWCSYGDKQKAAPSALKLTRAALALLQNGPQHETIDPSISQTCLCTRLTACFFSSILSRLLPRFPLKSFSKKTGTELVPSSHAHIPVTGKISPIPPRYKPGWRSYPSAPAHR